MEPLAFIVGCVDVPLPANRLVGDLERLEHLVVEAVLAHQAVGDVGEEEPRLGTLNDPVVVGGGEGNRLAHTQVGDCARVGCLEARWVPQRSHPDDEPLARHEPRDRLDGSECPRVGQGHRGPGEIVRGDLVGVDLAHQLLVGGDEAAEVPGVRLGDARHQEGAVTARLLHVHRQPEADAAMSDDTGRPLAVGVGHEGGVHGRDGDEPLDHRVADQVGEADLAPGGPEELVVGDGAIDLEELGRNDPHAGGGGNSERCLHVGHDATGSTAQGDRRGGIAALRLGGGARPAGVAGIGGRAGDGTAGAGAEPPPAVAWCRGGRCRRCSRSGRCGRCGLPGECASGGRRRAGRAVVGEELSPRLGHRGRIDPIPVIHVLDQPRIGAERSGPGDGRFGALPRVANCSGRLQRSRSLVRGLHRHRAYRPASTGNVSSGPRRPVD